MQLTLATLHLETPDFIRPLIGHVINGGVYTAVYNHCKASNHSFKPEEVVILDKEDRWFERGVREAIWERVEQPALDKEGAFASNCRTHGMRRSDVFPTAYHVTNQRPDEVWSFQTQRSQSELQKLISSI